MPEICTLETLPEPTTERVCQLRNRVSPERWTRIVAEAQEKVHILHQMQFERRRTQDSWRKCLQRIAPEVTWSGYLHWRRKWGRRTGQEWERLLDTRLPPPPPPPVAPEIREVAIALRMVYPEMSCQTARGHLSSRFQERGRLSDSSLRRVWRAAGLARASGDPSRFEKVEEFHGGGGLALIGAAAVETGIPLALATAALKAGREAAQDQNQPVERIEPRGRDERGRLTGEWNRSMHRNGPDPRWLPDAFKRDDHDLNGLQLLTLSPEVVAQRMLAMGMVGLLTQRRGFDGLQGIQGGWLGVLGQPAYQPSTLDKTLAELALLGVDNAVWHEHGRQWMEHVKRWHPDSKWKQIVFYVDNSSDPYWTRRYAASGPVSRVGRIMPCLTRTALTAGPGVPLLVETCAGGRSLLDMLPDAIRKAGELLGPGELGRVTVVDAEAASADMLWKISDLPGHRFVTVVKGRKVVLEEPSNWEPHGEHDRIRSGRVTLRGDYTPPEGVRLYAVERERIGSRHPKTTVFVTDAPPEERPPHDVVDLYVTRWPNQEQIFRDGRNGIGQERSHGYTGEYVTHVALETNLEKAELSVTRAEAKVEAAKAANEGVHALQNCAQTPEQKSAAKIVTQKAEKEVKTAKKALDQARGALESLRTMPREIYKRDTTRQNIASALALTVMMLIEFVLREYFGNLKMEYRTFIEHFVNTPTVVRTNRWRILYQLEANPRSPERTEQLRQACIEVTRRKIRKNGRRLVFEVVNPPEPTG